MSPRKEDVLASIVEFLAQATNVPPGQLTPDMLLGDLNIDSLSAVEMLWTVEHTYGVRLPDPEEGVAALSIDALATRFAALLVDAAPIGTVTAQAAGAQ